MIDSKIIITILIIDVTRFTMERHGTRKARVQLESVRNLKSTLINSVN